ncbi:MAG: tRNA-dihydrouridine synthase, partial [Plesiomonas sp.]
MAVGRVILAPMEGVLDPLLRDLLTRINAYDLCVTEFVRVVDALLPEHLFYRLCPELHHGGLTPSGTPVRVQLLGQSPQWLAENAARAVALGSQGVDLNCGCPSKKVNGSDGGASLLKDPDLIYRAAKAMREAVPNNMPVTVKVRLGWDSTDHSM